MEAVRESWSEERMDDNFRLLREEMRAQGTELREAMHAQGTELRKAMQAQGAELRMEMRVLRVEMNDRFAQVDTRLDSMQRTMIQFAGALIVALVGLFAAQIGLFIALL